MALRHSSDRRPEPDFKAILTNQKKQIGNRGSGSEKTPCKEMAPHSDQDKQVQKQGEIHQLRTSSAEDDEVDIIDLNGERRGWHTSLAAVGKPLSLPFGSYRAGQGPRFQCLSYFFYKNTSKGQICEEFQVLLLVSGTLFCFIVHHGLSFEQPCT